MSKRVVETLSRAGIPTLYAIAGKAAVDLLERIESKALSAHGLAQLVVDRWGPSQAIQASEIRALLLESLRAIEAESLCEVLGFETDDPYATLAGIDFGRSETLMATLHAFFGVPYEPEEEVEPKPGQVTATAPYTLFLHQRIAALRVRAKLQGSRARVLLHMPTGAGKTRTAMTTIVDLLRGEPDGQVVVWLAHSEELCDQAFDEAAKAWSAIGSRELTMYRHYGTSRVRDFAEVRDGIVVGSSRSSVPRQSASAG